MRIAVFAKRTTFHENYGGLETQNKLLCEGLAKRGHDVTVFSPDWGLSEEFKQENKVTYIFVKSVYRMGPLFGFFGTKQKSNWINRSVIVFSEHHKKQKFDIVLAQSSTGLGIIFKKKEFGVKVISISHGTIIGEYKTFMNSASLLKDMFPIIKNTAFTLKNFFRRQREFVHGSDKIIAVSNYVKQALIDETFTLEDKVVVINNGIDPSGFNNETVPLNRGRRLLYVGQVLKSKGLEDLYKIFTSLEFSDLQIDIVGSGDYYFDLKKMVESTPGLSERFRLLGKTSSYKEVVDKYYTNLEYGAFLFPSKRYEGFPMVLAESMFAGLPVVAYNVGGVPDAVVDNETGYLIPADNLNLFKNRVLELLSSQDIRDTFSRNAKKRAYANFTLDKMIDSYEKVIMDILK